jgi:F-type H+-transporting ATPase subunit delta
MSKNVAKKYAKALMDGAGDAELKGLGEAAAKAAALFTLPKFREIVASPLEETEAKAGLVLEATGKDTAKFVNLVNLLAGAKRLPLLPAIAEEVRGEIARRENRYEGTILSPSPVSAEEVAELESKLSGKLETTVSLSAVI